jgi:SpoIID/LytB domain protein
VLERGRSGRVIRLRVTGERDEVDVVGELRIRRALGDLRSSLFVVELGRDSHGRFVLTGGGHGHGVGMCQHGAIGMARAGKSHGRILAHYYKDSKTAKLW